MKRNTSMDHTRSCYITHTPSLAVPGFAGTTS
ncbi:MAG: hypothetical protein ACI9KE_005114, partial [Polyangiales bacterium]